MFEGFRWSVLPIPGRLIALCFFALLFIFPLIVEHPYYLRVLTLASIFVVFAVSWDLLSGYCGQVNFGHALFFGVGAYSSALMFKYLGWQPWATIPIGGLVATLTGVVTCLPALRLRGPYLSLLTLAFPIMLLALISAFKDVTGGEYGIWGLPPLAGSRVSEYYICFIVMSVVLFIMWKLTDSRIGLMFHAIREDEIAARVLGINTIRYKLLAFAIGGLVAGIAGGFYVHVLGVASPSTLALTMSFQAVIWVVFGGITSIYGAVVGVYILYPLGELSRGTFIA
jgi:branched-chain amino acid transport system permease protein